MMSVFGELDENIERLTDAFDVDVFAMGTGVKVSGEKKDVEGTIRAIDALEKLCKFADRKHGYRLCKGRQGFRR